MSIDRKAAIRDYKQAARPMGVGAIRRRDTGKSLVVSGVDIASLLNRHQAQLRLNAHKNRALQAEWDALGAEAFEFVVLDTLKPPEDTPDYDPAADLRALEELWIEKLQPRTW